MSGAVKWGGEFLLNTTTANIQVEPAITGLADGRFVATWSDLSQTGGDTKDWAVRAQLFNADGSKAGSEFLVNTTTWSAQQQPAVAGLADGRFVATWTDHSQTGGGDTSLAAVRGQVFNADGSKAGFEFLVNTTTPLSQSEPAITGLADGRFVVAWTDESESADDPQLDTVRAQVFNADGSKAGFEFLVNTSTGYHQNSPTITGLAGGHFVASWTDSSQDPGDTSGYAARAQVFTADGNKVGSEFVLNTTTSSQQYNPTVTALANGGFAAAWQDLSNSPDDASISAVRGQVFDANGVKTGAEFLVNTTISGVQWEPSIAALADSRFVVAWVDFSKSGDDASGIAIRAQVFDADGAKSGVEFLVNTTTAGDQVDPSVTTLADGRFVVTWTDGSHSSDDPLDNAVRGQIFDAREHAVHVDGTTLGDDYVGTGFNDTMGGAGGNDHLVGAGGADKLDGGLGSDTLDGGAGNDMMTGGAGDDTFAADSTGDAVSEGVNGGIDTVNASATYTLSANVENLNLTGMGAINGTGNGLDNTIYGNGGANILNGAAGADTLVGGSDNDTFVGGAGRDLMTGGGGLDHFNFAALSDSGASFATRDVINTYAHGDKVDLSALDANANAAGNQAFVFVTDFTHAAGQLEWTQTAPTGYLVQGDTNGDGAADFSLQIYAAPGFGTLHGWDFVL